MRTFAANGHRVTPPVQRKALHALSCDFELPSPSLDLCCGLGWRSSNQRFGKLTDATFDQQTTGQLDQILRCDRPNGSVVALRGQVFTLTELAVIPVHITFDQISHLRGLCLPKSRDRLGRVQPVEKHITGQIVSLLKGQRLRPKVFRSFAIDRDHFVGQQAQVVLSIGIPNAVTQTALIGGANMRHAKRRAPNLCTDITGDGLGQG